MKPRDSRTRLRLVLAAAAAGVSLLCALQTARFLTAPAPFHQSFRLTSAAENDAVTRRLIAAHVGLPSAAAATLALAAPSLLLRRRRTCLLAAAALFFLSALAPAATALSLPYGFGDAYEHAAPAQLLHLRLAKSLALTFLVLGAASLIIARKLPRSGAASRAPA